MCLASDTDSFALLAVTLVVVGLAEETVELGLVLVLGEEIDDDVCITVEVPDVGTTEVKVPVKVAVAIGTIAPGMGIPFSAAALAITAGWRVDPTLSVREVTMDDSTAVSTPDGTENVETWIPGTTTPAGSVNIDCAAT